MKVLLFGKLGELVGREVSLEPSPGLATMAGVRKALARAYPAASADLLSPRVRACVNDAVVSDSYPIAAGDEIGLLPAVSGG
jgi:molybdopterin converting factor small subunit